MADWFYRTWPEEEQACAPSHAALHMPMPDNVTSSLRFPGSGSSCPISGEVDPGNGAASASKSHSQAEKRRRDRINAHLATLRKLIPKSEKMDKAALLGSVIDRVKDLKREAAEASNKASIVPTEVDEVTIDYYDCDDDDQDLSDPASCGRKSKGDILIRATVCCDDQPELFPELVRALKGLRLRLVKADIASLEGRIKSILVLCAKNSEEEGVCALSALRQSLGVVLSRIATSSAASSCRFTSKRQRFFFTSHSQ